jgi:hypothetical protein
VWHPNIAGLFQRFGKKARDKQRKVLPTSWQKKIGPIFDPCSQRYIMGLLCSHTGKPVWARQLVSDAAAWLLASQARVATKQPLATALPVLKNHLRTPAHIDARNHALLVPNFSPKFHYAKRRFPVTSKYRHMHGVLNVDKIKN